MPAAVGPFRVVRPLATGGMATVYEVVDPETGRSYAAKVMSEATGSATRFGREYRALTRLDHPNVVRVFRYGVTEEGAPYLVMELLLGVPAQVRVKSVGRPGDPVRTTEALRIAMNVARALDYLHARGIIHRDLKSSNVMVLGDGVVKVLDFGTARLLGAKEALTEPGEFVGTFHYASPEQLTGAPVGSRADLYALGVLLYRMLCGKRPFEAEHPHTLARMHLEDPPVPPRKAVPAIPESVSAIVLHLLEKHPDDRPPSAAAVVEMLQAHAGSDEPRMMGPPSLRAFARQAQTKAAHQVLDRPMPGGALFFSGIEGSGRGRLVDLALEEAAQRGHRVLPVAFTGLRRPIADLAERLLHSFVEFEDNRAADAAQRLMRQSRPDPEALATALAARAHADGIPVVIGAHDVDRGPRVDVECLFAAMESLYLQAAPVLLFGTWNEGPVPKSWPTARTVAVPPLTTSEVAVLASAWLGVSAVSPDLVRRLLNASGGMPGPLEALVRALPRQGPEGPLVLPEAVRDAMTLKLESLPPLQRRAAETVALAEGDLALDQIAYAIDEPEDVARAALDALVAERTLVHQEGRWTFRVGLAGDLVRERTRPTRRHLLCRRLAQTVLGTPSSSRIAEVMLAVGLVEQAAACAVAWAQPLVKAGLHREALPLLERVAVARGGSHDSPLWRLFAECLAEVRPGAPVADHAVKRARDLASHGAEVGEAELAAARLARSRGDTLGERETLERAVERLVRAGARERATIALERLSRVCALMGDLGVARMHARDAMMRADGIEAVRAGVALALAETELGDLRSAEKTIADIVRGEAEAGIPWMLGCAALAGVLRLQGRFTEARTQVEGVLALARTQAPVALYASMLLSCAQVDLDLYRIGQARERLAVAMDALRGGVPGPLEATIALLRARLKMFAGDDDAALAELDPAIDRATVRHFRLHAARLRAWRAIVLCRGPRGAEGVLELDEARIELGDMGAMPDLAAIAGARAEQVDGAMEADGLFAETTDWMEMQPARVARLEYLLAAARRGDRVGDPAGAEAARVKAAALFGQIRRLLSAEDDQAMMVHPWRQALGAHG